MCTFCDALKDSDKEIEWDLRSTYADDNICEFVNGTNCSCCNNCYMKFEVYGYEHDEATYVGIGYAQEIQTEDKEDVIIRPFSETVQFNYCPFCGKQISKVILEFDKTYNNHIKIKEAR